MAKLITVERAEREIKRLQHYINLVKAYEDNTLEKWIIKEYAYTNSIVKVINNAKEKGITHQGKPLEREYAIAVISGKATDELHRILKSGYNSKVKPNKSKYTGGFLNE